MPNWASTSYVVTGDEKQLKDLHGKMISLEKRMTSLVDNGFGKTFLGNLVELLGGKIDGGCGVYCRGYWESCYMRGSELHFCTETAWDEMYEWRNFLEQHYPDLSFYYITAECGCLIYKTNDANGLYFPYRFEIEIYDKNEGFYEFKTYEEAKAKAEEIIGRKLEDSETIESALDLWAEENEIEYASYREYEIVDY